MKILYGYVNQDDPEYSEKLEHFHLLYHRLRSEYNNMNGFFEDWYKDDFKKYKKYVHEEMKYYKPDDDLYQMVLNGITKYVGKHGELFIEEHYFDIIYIFSTHQEFRQVIYQPIRTSSAWQFFSFSPIDCFDFFLKMDSIYRTDILINYRYDIFLRQFLSQLIYNEFNKLKDHLSDVKNKYEIISEEYKKEKEQHDHNITVFGKKLTNTIIDLNEDKKAFDFKTHKELVIFIENWINHMKEVYLMEITKEKGYQLAENVFTVKGKKVYAKRLKKNAEHYR